MKLTDAQQKLIDRAAFVHSRGEDRVYTTGDEDDTARELEGLGLGRVGDGGYMRLFLINDKGVELGEWS